MPIIPRRKGSVAEAAVVVVVVVSEEIDGGNPMLSGHGRTMGSSGWVEVPFRDGSSSSGGGGGGSSRSSRRTSSSIGRR